jgi:probable F420-dependent oxidoreductase
MKFGIAAGNTGTFGTAEGARALGAAAEDAGIDSIWTVEHVIVPQGYESIYPYGRSGRMPGSEDVPIPDPLIWLAHLAAVTSTVRLATGILIAPQRNPLVLAKQCATLDQLAGGRLVLGVGAGWLSEEYEALGIPFEDRGRRLDDHIGALRAAWGEQPASFDGEFTQFSKVYSAPQPVDGSVPIVVGGHSPAAARRAGRLGDGFFPGRGSLESTVELLDIMRKAAREAGRDPDAIEVTTWGRAAFEADPVEAVQAWEDAGVHRMVILPPSFDLEEIGPALADVGDRVISKVG